VTVQVDSQTTASGVVQGVTLVNGTPQVTVNNTSYNVSQVISVTPPTVAQTPSSSPTSN